MPGEKAPEALEPAEYRFAAAALAAERVVAREDVVGVLGHVAEDRLPLTAGQPLEDTGGAASYDGVIHRASCNRGARERLHCFE